jgi:DNA-binding NarL/FixJ family response regulator
MKGAGEEEGDSRSDVGHVIVHEPHLPPNGLEILTDRERQVVDCLARGYSTKEVGFALGIADATVRVLIARAASKLGVRSREALLNHPAVRPLRPAATGVE